MFSLVITAQRMYTYERCIIQNTLHSILSSEYENY